MLSDAEMHERMVRGWRAGKPETICGNGSMLETTRNVRAWLPDLIERLDVAVLADAGAGDLYWIRRVQWKSHIEYRPYDLIPRAAGITQWDITRDALPKCDAILCRMVLNHLDAERNLMALDLFRRSATWLIATQFNGEDLPQRSPQFTRLDLRHAPYFLGKPMEWVQDGAEDCCTLALWRL